MIFVVVLYYHLIEIHSWIEHSECAKYIPNIDFGYSLYIAFKPVGDLLHYVHPPSFTVFRSTEKVGEWLHSFPKCIVFLLHRL